MSAQNPFGALGSVMTSAAALNNAKYGNTGNSFFDTIRPFLDVVGGAYSAYQGGARNGLVIPGVMNALQSAATRNYMNQYQQQRQLQAMQYGTLARQADPNNPAFQTTGANGATTTVPFYGDANDLNTVLGLVGNTQLAGTFNNMAQNKPLQFGGAIPASIQASVGNNYMTQVGAATNFLNAPSATTDALGQGQNESYAGGRQPGKSFGGALAGAAGATGGQAQGTPQADGTMQFSTGTQYTAPQTQYTYLPTNVNPYFMTIDIPAQVAGMTKAGVEDAQQYQTNQTTRQANAETGRHNLATEGLQTKIYEATRRGEGGYGFAPQQPQLPTNASIAAQMYGNGKMTDDQMLQYLDANGGKVDAASKQKLDSINAYMKAKGWDTSPPGDGWLGMGASSAADKAEYQQLTAARQALMQQIIGGANPAPTATGAQQNVNQVGATAQNKIQFSSPSQFKKNRVLGAAQ